MSSKIIKFLLILVIAVGGILVLKKTLFPEICANTISCKDSLSQKIENGSYGIFDGQKITPPYIDLKGDKATKVLGEAIVPGDKHIYVDLSTQTLSAFQGETLFMKTLVSTGKWFPTPTGDFSIWEKIRSTRMTGGEGNDYYDLPNVPFDMFFSGSGVSAGQGFAIHGAYWHNNFGHPMSHGCINMRIIDVEKLYNWAEVGTPITIYGQAPL